MILHAPHTQCAHCSESMLKAHRLDGAGRGYCQRCSYQLFKPATCTQCGKPARAHPDDATALCLACRRAAFWADKVCVRCQRAMASLPNRHGPGDGTICCQACYRHLHPKTCAYCGDVHHTVGRYATEGFTEPVCYRCRIKAMQQPNCAGCHRPRHLAGTRENGKGYCVTCLPTGHPPVITCTDCGRQRHAYSKTLCEDCGWARCHARLIKRLLLDFPVPWTRELFEAYHVEARLKQKRGSWMKALRSDAGFFRRLGEVFVGPDELSGVALVQRLGCDLLEHHQRVMSFLAHYGKVDLNDPEFALEKWLHRQAPKLIPADEGWVTDVLQRFLAYLLTARKKAQAITHGVRTRAIRSPRSFHTALRNSRDLMRYARDKHGVGSLQELTQTELNLFLGSNRARQVGLRSFLRYVRVNEHTFHRLCLSRPRRSYPMHLVLPAQKRRDLIATWSHHRDGAALRLGLIALFALVYAQRPIRSVAMTMAQVRESDTGYDLRFAKDWVTLDQKFVPMMRLWLSRRREISGFETTDSSTFLFPGMSATTHLGTYAVNGFLQAHKVKSRELVPTAIATLIRHGLSQPRVLIDAFGIESSMAASACLHLGTFTQDQARYVVSLHA